MSAGIRKIGFVFAAMLALGACKKSGGESGGGGGGGGGGGEPAAKEFTPEQLDEIRKLQVEGFECTVQEGMKSVAQIWCQGTEKNEAGSVIGAQVMAQACMMCQKPDVALWEGNKENLQMMLSAAHKENPDLVFEIEEIDLGGKKGIAIYTKSFIAEGPSKSSAHGLDVHFNNGTNQLVMMLSTRGSFPDSLEDLEKSASKEDFIAAAQKIFGALAQYF